MKKFSITFCYLMIFVCSNISFANGDQVAYRWRNDNGDVYSATWKDSVNTPVALTDYENIRLRIEDLVGGNADTSNISLRYAEDLYNANWIPITNDDTGKFVISPSQYLIDTMSFYDNQLLPPFYQDNQYRRTITIDSSISYLLLAENNSIYEFEYSIKPTSKIQPGSEYFFSCFMDSTLMHSWEVNEYAVLMTLPVSWTTKTIYRSYVLQDVCFIDANNGTAVGYDQFGSIGKIFSTIDGGENWVEQVCPTDQPLISVYFINSDVGIAVGSLGRILRTTDGGQNWFLQASLGSNKIFHDISFSDENNGTIVGGYGYGQGIIFRTTDGGQTWFEQACPTYSRLTSVYFITSNTGSAVGEYGAILRTTNGGQNWFVQSSGSTGNFNDVCFTDENHGTAVGYVINNDDYEGIIFRTADGGKTWEKSINSKIPTLFAIQFANNNTGWVSGACGWILKTTDGGMSWKKLTSGAYTDLSSIHFVDSETGWAVGGNKILKTTNGGIATFVEEEQIDEIPTAYTLFQNYPNPFNPSTKIIYSIPASLNPSKGGTSVTLKIYDLLGREIETLVNEEKPVGTYEVTWNAKDLPSGVYFYQLKAGEFVDTKKMILLQ